MERRRKLISALIALFIVCLPLLAFAEPEGGNQTTTESDSLKAPDIQYAEAAVLLDMDSGRLLYGKNISEHLAPASTTKMITGILALEKGNMADTVTVTYDAIKDITLDDSHMGLLIGEQLTMEQLVNGLLVYSANDAANVIAIHVAGSTDAFVTMMNEKAQQLGMSNTHFTNTCGLPDDNHYTSAEDLAILAKYCMQNEAFREIVKKPSYTMPATNKYQKERILQNTNLFLGTSRSSYHYYAPCIGIKTGHTDAAGHCLVSAAQYNDISLIAVVLKCKDEDVKDKAYSYTDSKKLFEYGFNNYTSKKVASPGDVISDSKVYEAKDGTRVAMTVPSEIKLLLPKDADTQKELKCEPQLDNDKLKAPIKKGDILGKAIYSYNGKQLATVDLVSTNDVQLDNIMHVIHIVINVIKSPFFFIPVIVIILLAVISTNNRKRRERKQRIRQLKRDKRHPANGKLPDRNASQAEIQKTETKGSTSRYKE